MIPGQQTYQPKTGFTRWLDSRLPLIRFVYDHLLQYPTPRNLNVWYTFGGILTFFLGAQIVTGIVLAMHYTADAERAFDSIEHIMRDVNGGWLIRYLHANGASMFFLAVYIHMFRGLYYGSYKAPREILWILGVLIYALMILTAFLGYTLPWGQMSFWAATVITSLFSAIPVIGEPVVQWLWGGFGVDDPTLKRFFSLHYLLPFVLAGVVALHIWALHIPGNNNPLGIDAKAPRDTVPFHPYYTAKDLFYLSCFLLLFAYFVFFAPEALVAPENAEPANPIVTPPEIVPEWYFLPFYAILRSIPDKLMGVIALFTALGVLFFVPWLDGSQVRSARFRPVYRQFFWIFFVDCLLLGYVGANPVDATLLSTSIPLVWIGRFATVYYFLFFLVILPLVGRFERPNPLPERIGGPHMGHTPQRAGTAT
jgi:ubiquinol-cytochrome c reductase cytochrome b/c1 subunit